MSPSGDGPHSGATLILFTDREGVRDLLSSAAERELERGPSFSVTVSYPMDEKFVPGRGAINSAAVGVIDILPDVAHALRISRRLHGEHPGLPLVGLVCCPHDLSGEDLAQFEDAGVSSFLDFANDGRALMHAIQHIAQGHSVVHLQSAIARPESTPALVRRFRHADPDASPQIDARQQAVLSLLGAGLTREQIADREHISARTVKRLIAALEEALQAPSMFELGMKAAQLGLLPRR